MNRLLCRILAGLLLAMPIRALSQTQHLDWITKITDDKKTVFSYNINLQGNILMETCSSNSNKCTWLMAGNTPCIKGASSRVLINSDDNTDSTMLICDGKFADGIYSYKFLDWSLVDNLTKYGKGIAIVISIPGNQFKIYRFSLLGMAEAQKETEEIWKHISGFYVKSHSNHINLQSNVSCISNVYRTINSKILIT